MAALCLWEEGLRGGASLPDVLSVGRDEPTGGLRGLGELRRQIRPRY